MATILGHFSQNGVKSGSEVFCTLLKLNNNENPLSLKSLQYFEKIYLIIPEKNQIQINNEAILNMRQVI